nr:hypothetical protein pA58H2_p33 [Arthrobacter sp.]
MAGSIYEELLSYSKGLQPWQRDALRRLTASPHLFSADINELTDIAYFAALQNQDGLLNDETPSAEAPVPSPMTSEHVPSNDAVAPAVSLVKVHHLQGVNRMRVPTNIRLNPKGLNVVFGYNGVGKSGYTRILKSSCHSKHPEPVLGNVYHATNLDPLAKVEYLLGETAGSHEWNLNAPSNDVNLARVAVYDAKSASAHVSAKGTELTVTPQGLDLLTNLVTVYGSVATEAKNRIAALNGVSGPGIASEATDPAVRKAMGVLGSASAMGHIETLSTLDDAEQSALVSLPGTISHRRTNSQAARLAQANAKLNQHRNQARRIEILAAKVSSGQMASLKEIRGRLREIVEEEQVQSEHDFSQELLPGVMSPPLAFHVGGIESLFRS